MGRCEPQMKHDTGGRIAAETWDGVERRADGLSGRSLENGKLDAAALEKQERDKLVMEHLPQVHHIARRIHDRLPPHVALEDLVHAGILGLMDAVKKYDTNKNVELKHYAKFRIRGRSSTACARGIGARGLCGSRGGASRWLAGTASRGFCGSLARRKWLRRCRSAWLI